MTFDWSFLPSVISAASGLGGVWLGGWLTGERERQRELDQINKESSYLAILVVAHLERFINGCADVAFDDGTIHGQPAGKQGCHSPTADAPKFDPLGLSVNWKVLPADLMYDILHLPYRVEVLANHISAIAEHDDPPDYAGTFWARQHGYAALGLEVVDIARRLRRHAGLPEGSAMVGDWNRNDALRDIISELEKAKAKAEGRSDIPI